MDRVNHKRRSPGHADPRPANPTRLASLPYVLIAVAADPTANRIALTAIFISGILRSGPVPGDGGSRGPFRSRFSRASAKVGWTCTARGRVVAGAGGGMPVT